MIVFYSKYFLNLLKSHTKVTNIVLRVFPGIILLSLLSTHLSWTTLFLLTWINGIVSILGAQFLSIQGTWILLTFSVGLVLVKTITIFFSLLNSSKSASYLYILGDYASLTDNYVLQLQLLLDLYSISYIILTSVIGLWALLFATNYMRNEPRVLNFLNLLYMFLISMILLLASGNFPTLMLGWELIGCFSFLLINFWTTRIGTAKSAFKAFFFNKLSDVSLILTFLLLIIFLPETFTFNFTNLYLLDGVNSFLFGVKIQIINLVMIGLIICSFCKSAQFGFHVWLPDSMEAPVPASALIHSATLVSAGIFLLGRIDYLTSITWASTFLTIWCSFTALYGGLIAAYQTDLKKILAYSTISHCGFLFLLVIYNNFFALVLYLHLHGWFKSYSFMAAGNIISKYLGYQDYRRMGGSIGFNTLELLVLIISISCLGGLPFLLGFFNKHFLLFLTYEYSNMISYIFLLSAAFTGLFYTLKTIYGLTLVIFKNNFFQKKNLINGLDKTYIYWPSEPWSNVVLLGIYPLFICSLAAIILTQDFWNIFMIFHSTFGIFFFILYISLVLFFFKNSFGHIISFLLSTKLLYTLC